MVNFVSGHLVMLCRPYLLKGWKCNPRQQTLSISAAYLALKSPVDSLGGFNVPAKSLQSRSSTVRATGSPKANSEPEDGMNRTFEKITVRDWMLSLGIFALWLGLIIYATQFSPNQVPAFDAYLLRKFLFLEVDEVQINPIFVQVFFAMGIWPVIYSALLIPGQFRRRSPPAWPFCLLAFGFGACGLIISVESLLDGMEESYCNVCYPGAFALIPYMALWRPEKKHVPDGPPTAVERVLESKILAGGCTFALSFIIYNILYCNSDAWVEFASLFLESRFVHITLVDFATLTLLSPFWVANDAQERNWDAGYYGRAIIFLPLLGPALYLLLRPRKSL